MAGRLTRGALRGKVCTDETPVHTPQVVFSRSEHAYVLRVRVRVEALRMDEDPKAFANDNERAIRQQSSLGSCNRGLKGARPCRGRSSASKLSELLESLTMKIHSHR